MTAACAHRDVWLNNVLPDGDDEPRIDSHVGELPVRVYYDATDGPAILTKIEDDQGREISPCSFSTAVQERLRRECDRERDEAMA
jgi:hypothetical protein